MKSSGKKPPVAKSVIRDRTMRKQGFDNFVSSSVSSDGRELVVKYKAGAAYRLPLEYLVYWFDDLTKEVKRHRRLRLLKSRRIHESTIVRIYLSTGTAYDICWDTVLMACEPRYEHYGGLTPHSKELTREWETKHGSFLIE